MFQYSWKTCMRSLAIDDVSVYNLCVSLILEELCAIICNWCTSLSINTLMCGLLVYSFISFNDIITILAWYHQFRVIERVLPKRLKPVHTSHYMNLIPVRAPLMGGTWPVWYTPCWFFILGSIHGYEMKSWICCCFGNGEATTVRQPLSEVISVESSIC